MRAWLASTAVFATGAVLLAPCLGKTQTFLSRPGQVSVTLDVLVTSSDVFLAPGYIFTTPYANWLGDPADELSNKWGPHIFDQEGNLVWWGNHTVQERAFNLHPCAYETELPTHLCFSDGNIESGHTFGTTRILDNTYTQVRSFGNVEGLGPPDGHELNIATTRLIQDVFVTVPKNLEAFGGPKDGYVIQGCFQEIDTQSEHVLFQWCSLDHVPLEETYNTLRTSDNQSDTLGKGTSDSPWDYFHINAVDRDTSGDYYVSSKNTWTIYKIAGANSALAPPGIIIWRLDGKYGDFKIDAGLHFQSQHHVRIHSVGTDESILSIFDNAYDINLEAFPSRNVSSGKIIAINNRTMCASLREKYPHPGRNYSPIQGSTQTLSNGNVFIGWGTQHTVSEHAPGNPGKLLFYAQLAGGQLDLESYRNFKLPWKGYPTSPPDVFAYAETCDSDVYVYMSWNGATEYRSWSVYATNSSEDHGSRLGGGTFPRLGYETIVHFGILGASMKYVYVEALDSQGQVLGISKLHQIYIPKAETASHHGCNATRCQPNFEYRKADSIVGSCSTNRRHDILSASVTPTESMTEAEVLDEDDKRNVLIWGSKLLIRLLSAIFEMVTHPSPFAIGLGFILIFLVTVRSDVYRDAARQGDRMDPNTRKKNAGIGESGRAV